MTTLDSAPEPSPVPCSVPSPSPSPEPIPESADRPALRVVAGTPTPDELAAVVAALYAVAAAASTSAADPDGTASSPWAAPATRLGTAYGPGRRGWRTSALPR